MPLGERPNCGANAVWKRRRSLLIHAAALIGTGCSTFSTATTCPPWSKDSIPCVRFISAHDGDTFKVELPDAPLLFQVIPVRVRGIDAAEISSKDKCEQAAATRQRDALSEYCVRLSE